MFSRTYNKIHMGGKLYRHVVTLASPRAIDSIEKTMWQLEMLRQLAESQGILKCGTGNFQTLSVCYDDQRWIAEMVALEEDP